MTSPPLFDLYLALREKGLLLGIEEYKLLVKALQRGFGLPDRDALERLCKTLWVKSAEDERIFDQHFEQYLPPSGSNNETESLSEIPENIPDQPADLPTPTSPLFSDTQLEEFPYRNPSSPTKELASEFQSKKEKSVLAVNAIKPRGSEMITFPPTAFLFSDEYFPVNRRQMKQSWRHFRHPIRQGPPEELDIDATLDLAAQRGMLIELILTAHRLNRAELVLLLDQGGSMVPFHMFSQQLVETVKRGGHLGKIHTYYFHNCPIENLYLDTIQLEYQSIYSIFNRYYPSYTGVLIFSDAGAARGVLNPKRIELTEIFLELLKHQFRHIAWLNPMPAGRWHSTSAELISQSVAMFELSRQGLDNVINVLRGRTSHFVPHKDNDHE